MRDEQPEVQDKTAEETRRRTDRILAPVRIRVMGADANGTGFSEDTVTVSFNQQGARISLTHSLLPDDIVLILNKANNWEEEFRVVGGFQQVIGERREWGVEALHPENNIWGVEFTHPAEGMQPKALIDCGGCRRVVQTAMSSIEYDVLLATGMISRHCDRCNETTRWRPSDQTVLPEIIETGPKVSAPTTDRRRARRLKLVMRIRVQNSWGVTEIAQTRDVSKLGLCFLSTKNFSVGDEISVVLPYAFDQVPVYTKGKIIWSALSKGGRYYGVAYLK